MTKHRYKSQFSKFCLIFFCHWIRSGSKPLWFSRCTHCGQKLATLCFMPTFYRKKIGIKPLFTHLFTHFAFCFADLCTLMYIQCTHDVHHMYKNKHFMYFNFVFYTYVHSRSSKCKNQIRTLKKFQVLVTIITFLCCMCGQLSEHSSYAQFWTSKRC